MDAYEHRELDWDAAYRRGETPWERGAPAPPLLEFLQRRPIRGRVLVPGSGLGHDARAIAAAGADEVIAVDLSETAVAAAQALDNPPNLRFECCDFFGASLGEFDWVFEHTFISALDPELRKRYTPALLRHLRRGGRYLAIFFMNPWDEGEAAEPPPWGITDDEIAAMFGGRLQTLESWRPTQCYPGREGREKMALMQRPPDEGQ